MSSAVSQDLADKYGKPFGPIALVLTVVIIGFLIATFFVNRVLFLLPIIVFLVLPITILIPLEWAVFFLAIVATSLQAGIPSLLIRFGKIGVHPIEIAVGICLASWAIELLLKKRRLETSSTTFWLFLPFVLYNVPALFIGLSNLYKSGYVRFMNMDLHNALAFLPFIFLFGYFKTKEDVRRFALASFIGIFILSFLIFSPIILGPISPIPMGGRGRIFTQNMGIAALWYPVLLQYFALTKELKHRIIIILCLGFSIVALILTQYRTAWVGTSLSLFILFVINLFLLPPEKRLRFVLKGLLFFLLGVIFATLILKLFLPAEFNFIFGFLRRRVLTFKFVQYDPALLARRTTVHESKLMFPEHPIFGYGLGTAWHSLGYPSSHLDNLYWYALIKFGILGTVLFFLPFIYWGYELIYILKYIRKIKDQLIFSIALGLISFYVPFFIMHITVAHLLIAPAIIVLTLSFTAITEFIYRALRRGEEL